MTCDNCKEAIAQNQEHRFDDVDRKTVATLCNECCPRCWRGRREPRL